jgi:hypothetical protein
LKLTYQAVGLMYPRIYLPVSLSLAIVKIVQSLCSPRHVPLLHSQSLLACCIVRIGILKDVNNIYRDALTSLLLIYVIDMCVTVSVCLMLKS